MTTPSADVRARRPADHAVLIETLRNEAGFPFYYDVLLFAAAVGYTQNRRVPFSGTSGDVRYETLTGPTFSDSLINMLAANAVSDDPEVLDVNRLEERVRIFEEYANGGFEYIQDQINTRHKTAALVVLDIVTTAFADEGGAKPVSVDDLLNGAKW